MDDLNPSNIVVCIPAYNEEERIGEVIEGAKRFATRVIVFDDGSTDNTAEISRNSGARVIKNEKNEGYGKAIGGLLKFAKENNVDIMVTIDSDGQHDPDQIPSMIRPLLDKECDIVIGSRFIHDHDTNKIPTYRKFGIKTITKAVQIAYYNNITDAQSGFRAYNKVALSKLRLHDKGMSVSTEILIEAKDQGLKIIEVPITVSYDSKNSSTHHPVLHGLGVLSSVIRFITYSRPLLFYIFPGAVLFVVAAVFANHARELYIQSGYISTNLILVSIGTALIGFICVSTGAVIYTLKVLTNKKKNSRSSSRSSAIKFIIYRHPLLFYIIPGVALFAVAAVSANHARELYIQSWYISTNLILVSIGTALIGSLCLSTGAIIYTVMNLFKSEIHDV
jgi:glycosyltransferase involved in cell wall biosynthesis